MQLPAPVLAEEIPCPPVLVTVLQRNQGIEHVQYFGTDQADLVRRHDEDEIITPNVPHETARAKQALDDVVKKPGQQVDDPVAI